MVGDVSVDAGSVWVPAFCEPVDGACCAGTVAAGGGTSGTSAAGVEGSLRGDWASALAFSASIKTMRHPLKQTSTCFHITLHFLVRIIVRRLSDRSHARSILNSATGQTLETPQICVGFHAREILKKRAVLYYDPRYLLHRLMHVMRRSAQSVACKFWTTATALCSPCHAVSARLLRKILQPCGSRAHIRNTEDQHFRRVLHLPSHRPPRVR